MKLPSSKSYFCALCLTAGTVSSAFADVPKDLFISEYIEGSSYNKAVEIYNGTESSVNLTGYGIVIYNNGASDPNYVISLGGQINSGSTVVVSHTRADQAILDIAALETGSLSYNGDDALLLAKVDAEGNIVEIVDSIGQVGFDPGSSWGNPPETTSEATLVRLSSVCQGDTDAYDSFDPSLEWEGFAQNTFDNLGSHTIDCQPLGTEYTPITQIQTPVDTASDASPLVDQEVLITGVVTASFDSGFYLQGSGDASWNGIFVYTGSDATAPVVGDEVDVAGVVAEYYNLTEIIDPIVTVISSDNTVPDPVVLSTADVNDEQWEGVLIQVEAVEVTNDDLGYGEWSITDGTGELIVDDKGSYTYLPVTGQMLSSVIGVMDYSYGNYKIQPRTDEDISIEDVEPETVFIHDVQGSGVETPKIDQNVTVEGIVVGVFQENNQLRGFFLQEEDQDVDDNVETSEGIFVYHSLDSVEIGDLVLLTGTAGEYYNNTQIKSITNLEIISSDNPLPLPTEVALPFTDATYMERYEGMLTTFPQKLTVSENYDLGRYGELVLSNGRLMNPTNVAAPGDDAIALQAANALNYILLDDGSTTQNPDPIAYPYPELSADNSVRSGDTVQDLQGVIYYSYSEYRVQPTSQPVFEPSNPRLETPDDVGGSLKVASFNVLNYFTTIDDDNCPYDAGCRGADSEEEFIRQRAKIINALVAVDADIIGLMELENHPLDEPLLDLVQGLNEQLGETVYEAVYTGAIGTDAIKVGMIYKSAKVSLAGNYAILDSTVDPTFIDTKNRPTLAQTFMEIATGEKVTIAVNHLKSKGSDCEELDDPDTGDGQGNCNLTRTAAANALAQWLATDPTGSNDPDYLIIGDLNAYAKEDPVTALKDNGYVDLIETFGGEEKYSYIFYGQAGYLDHALANESLVDQVSGITEWHINSDEPKVLDYNTEFKSDEQVIDLYADNVYRASDHDPIIIGLNVTEN